MVQDGVHTEVSDLVQLLRQSMKPVGVLEDRTVALSNKTNEMERTIEAMTEAIIVLQETVVGLHRKVGGRLG